MEAYPNLSKVLFSSHDMSVGTGPGYLPDPAESETDSQRVRSKVVDYSKTKMSADKGAPEMVLTAHL